jgi:predicted exporter
MSAGTIGKAASTVRSAGRAMGQSGDVDRAQETVQAVQQQLQELEAQFQAEISSLHSAADPANEDLETVELRPTRTNINIRLVALVWLPFRKDALGVLNPAY